MKMYISAAMPLEDYRKHHPEVDDERFEELLALDPTVDKQRNRSGKYTDWIFLRNKDGTLTDENYHNLKDALPHFMQNSKKYTYQDLGRYKTVDEFVEDSHRVGNMKKTDAEKAKELKKEAHRANRTEENENVKLLGRDGIWELWQPKTYAGSIALARKGGAKAGWCTAWEGDDHNYRRYTSEGPLYIFIDTTNPRNKYQIHFPTKQFCSFENSNKGMTGFEKFLADKPTFQEILDFKLIDGCTIQAGNLIRIQDDAEIVDLSNLPAEITSISASLFQNKKNVREVILPDGVTELPAECFSGCSGLESITLPDTLQFIGESAFMSCRSLKSIILPDSVIKIGDHCFCFCRSLESVILSNSLVSIGKNAFNTCILLYDITFPDSLQTIGTAAFLNCRSLESVKLPKNLISLGSQAFLSCRELVNVQLPKSLQTVGKYIFKNCSSLSEKSLSIINKISEHFNVPLI